MTSRNRFYDNIRGFAIILVVIGHSIMQLPEMNSAENAVYQLIYSFHMPLFMFISGYINCTPGREKQYDARWLKRRFRALVIPYLIWIPLPYFFTHQWADFPEYLLHVIQFPSYAYWFLWVLFLNSFFFFLAWNFTQKWGGQHGISLDAALVLTVLVIVILTKLTTNSAGTVLGFGLLCWYSIYYFAGHIAHEHMDRLRQPLKIALPIAAIVWCVLAPFWRRDGSVINSAAEKVFSHSILVTGVNIAFSLLIGFCGTAFSVCVVQLLQRICKCKIINELGQYTLEIYILQSLFFNIFPISVSWLAILMNVVMGLIFPYLIAKVFEKGKGRALLFGRE